MAVPPTRLPILRSFCLLLAAACTTAVTAQTRSTRDATTAYGARLDAKGVPANQNRNRVNNRIPSRIDNRLSLRIERYQPATTANPTAAFGTKTDDKSRTAPVVAPTPQPQIQPPQPTPTAQPR